MVRTRSRKKARTKATCAAEARDLQDIPNVGPAVADALRQLGIETPAALRGRDAYAMHAELERLTGERQDPCVIDVFLAATGFMGGDPPRPWWAYTAGRKKTLAGG